jgi:hypothetical protein
MAEIGALCTTAPASVKLKTGAGVDDDAATEEVEFKANSPAEELGKTGVGS